MKKLIAVVIVCLCGGYLLGAEAETITHVARARVVMDLIKDNSVTTAANYADTEVDYIEADTALTYADAFCKYYGQYQDGTNAQKAAFFLLCLKRHCKDVRRLVLEREQDAAQAATNDSTIEGELGADEVPE